MTQLSGAQREKFKQPRHPLGWYTEPRWCDRQFFAALEFSGAIHDPCCGEGRIPEAAIEAGYKATGSDLVYRGFGRGGVDFLKDRTRRRNIVFNPPSNPGTGIYIDPFILHALSVAIETVSVIVPVQVLCGQDRFWDLYRSCPPSLVLACSQRPSMPPGGMGIAEKGGTTDYVWLVWSRSEPKRRICGVEANGWWHAAGGGLIDWLEPLVPPRQC